MAKLITTSSVHVMQQPPKSTQDLINDATDEEGNTLCIMCHSGWLHEEIRSIMVSEGFTTPRPMLLDAYWCNECNDAVITDKEAKEIREYLNG